MNKPVVYLDYNATSPLRPKVAEAMQEVVLLPLNASSVHRSGRQAKKIVEDTRRKFADYMNCWPQEVIWCSGASEANNAVLRQFGNGACLVSSLEHSGILQAMPNVETIPATADGIIDLGWLESRLNRKDKPALISVMMVNNETGVLQPVKEVVALARRYNLLTHTDAVQATGKMPLDFTSLGVDYMTLSFHKHGGPLGLAALLVKNGAPFKPLIRGGGQEYNRRAGTEHIAAIKGVDALLDCWSVDEIKQVKQWMQEMEKEILSLWERQDFSASLASAKKSGEGPHPGPLPKGEGAFIVSQHMPRLGNVSCIINPALSQEVQLMRLDMEGFCVSAGSACTSGKIEPSHVLRAMGVADKLAASAIRVSVGWNTSQSDCEAFVKAYQSMFTEGSASAKMAS